MCTFCTFASSCIVSLFKNIFLSLCYLFIVVSSLKIFRSFANEKHLTDNFSFLIILQQQIEQSFMNVHVCQDVENIFSFFDILNCIINYEIYLTFCFGEKFWRNRRHFARILLIIVSECVCVYVEGINGNVCDVN